MEGKEKNDAATFVKDIKSLHDNQRHDIKRTFCGSSGLYTIKEESKEFTAGTEYWNVDHDERKKCLDNISEMPLIVSKMTPDLLKPVDQLSTRFFPIEVSALKSKVQRILNGNIRLGFSGPKSRVVCSDSSE